MHVVKKTGGCARETRCAPNRVIFTPTDTHGGGGGGKRGNVSFMALVVKRTWAGEDLSPTRSLVSRCYKASEVALTTNDLLPRARSNVPFSLGPSVNLERQEKRHF